MPILPSLLDGHPFRLGRRDVRFWFSCISFFNCLVDPSPLGESVFAMVWRIKIPRKVRFFTWQVLHNQANILDKLGWKLPTLFGPFVVFFVERQGDLDHILWSCDVAVVVWDSFFQSFGMPGARHKDVCTISMESFPNPLFFGERVVSLACRHV